MKPNQALIVMGILGLLFGGCWSARVFQTGGNMAWPLTLIVLALVAVFFGAEAEKR